MSNGAVTGFTVTNGGFPIPMRGNESRLALLVFGPDDRVSDPHEG